MKVVWIRHFMTPGNQEKRYIGKTDEDILESEKDRCVQNYPQVEEVVISPMKRCRSTAQCIYPDQKLRICPLMAECDFGEFEGKNYLEMKEDPKYQRWIDSMGTLPFPNGESQQAFKERCISGMEGIMQELIKRECGSVAFVVHGGTIMSVLSAFSDGSFYDWQIKNGEAIEGEIDVVDWINGKKEIKRLKKI